MMDMDVFVNHYNGIKDPSMYNHMVELNKSIINRRVESSDFYDLCPQSIYTPEGCCGRAQIVQGNGSEYCDVCGKITRHFSAIAWADVSRVHSASTYSYDKKTLFKDLLLAFQGKGAPSILNTTMSKQDFVKSHKTLFRATPKMFMNYYKVTGETPPDISHLVPKLLKDYDSFADKSLQSNHILYQLLIKNNYMVTPQELLIF